MPQFEVHIPRATPDGIDVTARLRADSWTEALRQGLARLGDNADVRQVMCDISDDGVAVTEPKSGRVFRIREIAEGAAQQAKRPQPPAPPPTAPPPAPPAAPAPAARPASRPLDDLLGNVFLEVSRIDEQKTVKGAADLVLELAMKAVPAKGGVVFISSINTSDLHAIAARGEATLDGRRIPMGKGVVGTAAREGVAIAVMEHGRSIACSAAQRDGRTYGAVQLTGKPSRFTQHDMSVLDYLAGKFAEYLIATGQTGL